MIQQFKFGHSVFVQLKNHRATSVGMDLRSQHWILSAELTMEGETNLSGEADFRVPEHKVGGDMSIGQVHHRTDFLPFR